MPQLIPKYIIPKKNQYPNIKYIPQNNGTIKQISMYKSPVNALPKKCEECKYPNNL